jgi:hypothetical protein
MMFDAIYTISIGLQLKYFIYSEGVAKSCNMFVVCCNNKEFNVFYTFETKKPSFSNTLIAFKCGDNEEFISNFSAEY